MKMAQLERIIVIVLLSFQLNLWRVNCYPHGAPGAACDSMTPGHDPNVPQTKDCPYKIALSTTAITSGDTITIEITAPDATYNYFEGFMIKAVYDDDRDSTVPGVFTDIDHGYTKYINCSGYFRSAITHDTANHLTDFKAYWVAPYIDAPIVFLVSLVFDYDTFWVKAESEIVTVSFTGTTPPASTPIVWPIITEFDYSICGTSASCFGFPTQCIQSESCKMLVSYYLDTSDQFNFQLVSETPGYVAFGLSTDQEMGDDSVVQCMMLGPEISASASKNVIDKDNYVATNNAECYSLESANCSGTNLACQFTRPLATTVITQTQGDISTDLVANSYYLMLALGWTNAAGDAITLHKEKLFSNAAVNLTSPAYIIVDEEIFNYDVCGVSQSCFGYPAGCVTQRSCQYMVSYFPKDTSLEIQLSGKTDGYVALGLSTDTDMDDDSVIQCFYDSASQPSALASVNGRNADDHHANYNDEDSNEYIDIISAAYTRQILTCDVTRPATTTVSAGGLNITTDLISNKYFLFLAAGPVNDTMLKKHDSTLISVEKIDLMSDTFVIVDETPPVFNYDLCGFNQSCFGYPSGCVTKRSCQYMLSYFPNDTELVIQLSGLTDGYVAFGLSTDIDMDDDSVIQCFYDSQLKPSALASVTARNSEGHHAVYNADPDEYIDVLSASYTEQILTCAVTRPTNTTVIAGGFNVTTDLISEQYFLFLAVGVVENDTLLTKHDSHLISNEEVDLMSDTFVIIDEDVAPAPFDYGVCGVTQSCFGFPGGCEASKNCVIMVSYYGTGDVLEMDFLGTTSGYIALGLSTDDRMGDDSVLQCIINAGEGESQASINENEANYPATNNGYFTPLSSSYASGIVRCNVTRPMETSVKADSTGVTVTTNVKNSKYYLLLAYGPLNSDGSIAKHTDKIKSANAVDLLDIQIIGGNSKPDIKIMVHGSLMVVAWIGTVSVAIFMARYYKDMWPDSMWCKVKIWFAVHRALNVLTVVLTMVAFILIFVYKKGFSDPSVWRNNPHPILGTITMAFAILQPFGSIFRCAPGSPQRPIFNWIHYICGNTTCIIAVITIYFAVKLDAAQLPKSFYGILSGFLGFYCIMFIILECYTHMQKNQKKKVEKNIQKSDEALEMDVKKPGSSLFKQVMLAVFICGITGFVIALVTVICIGN